MGYVDSQFSPFQLLLTDSLHKTQKGNAYICDRYIVIDVDFYVRSVTYEDCESNASIEMLLKAIPDVPVNKLVSLAEWFVKAAT